MSAAAKNQPNDQAKGCGKSDVGNPYQYIVTIVSLRDGWEPLTMRKTVELRNGIRRRMGQLDLYHYGQ